jgi:DNA-binding response OmpR family regulator
MMGRLWANGHEKPCSPLARDEDFSFRSSGVTSQTEIILIVDDDTDLCTLLTEYLTHEGYAVETAPDGAQGLEKALTRRFSIIILDVMLPGGQSGYDVLKQLRERDNVPVLMLTARGDDMDRVLGLELGADDYLPKPFNPRELIARLRAILRRAGSETRTAGKGPSHVRYRIGDIEMDVGRRTVLKGGEPVDLTTVEFGLLERLLLKAGKTVTREEMTSAVLGRTLTPYDRSIDVHVSKLRKKLGPEADGTDRIRSIRGSGYVYILPLEPGTAELTRTIPC